MIKICSVAFLSLLLSASSLFAQTKTFAGADYSQGIVFVMENNQMVWKHKAPDSNDLWILPNGNILFTTGHGVLEMTRQNDTIFHYESKSPVFACQETCILPKGVKDGGFAFMRNARRLDNGHFLVAHYGDQCVKEYDANGKVVWKLDVPGGPHSLTRLPNGHTLIAVADKDQNPRLIEVTPEGKTIWEISNADIPGKPLKFLGGFQYFSDGRFLITNWTGHVNPKEKVHLLLVDRQKNVLYSLENTPELQTMSSVYSTDKPAGVASYH